MRAHRNIPEEAILEWQAREREIVIEAHSFYLSEEDLGFSDVDGLRYYQGQAVTGVIRRYYPVPNKELLLADYDEKLKREADNFGIHVYAQPSPEFYQRCLESGLFIADYLDGVQHYLDGMLHGLSVMYWPQMGVSHELMYHRGSKLWENIYYPNGQLRYHTDFIDDMAHGRMLVYNPQGNLQEEAFYVQGKREGLEMIYWAEGLVKRVTGYKAGKKHGLEKEYDLEGRLVSENRYELGRLVDSDR